MREGGQKNEAIRELGAAIRLDRRDSWTYALRDALQPSSGSAVEAEDRKQVQRYAIMGERVEYHDEPLDAISDDIAVNHASESSRTGGASEPPQRIVGKILKKMLIAKEREVFHPDYFWKRSRRIQDLYDEIPKVLQGSKTQTQATGGASSEGPGAG